jgi:hypothetical protein
MFEEAFRALCEEAAGKTDNLGTEFRADKKFAVFTLYRRLIKLELVFKRHSLGNVDNVLCCRVYPNKITEVFYLLPEVFVELDIDEYRAVFFPMIENEARLAACFSQLWSILSEHLPAIEKGARDGLLPWERKLEEGDFLERRLIFDSASPTSREPFVILDYTKGNVYGALLTGKRKKAIETIEKYRVKGKTLEYQNRLCDHLKEAGDAFSLMPDECNALRDAKLAEKKSVPVYIGMFLAVYAAVFAVILAAKLVFDLFFERGTVAVFGAPWYFCLLLAVLPAFIGTVVFRKGLMRLLFPKRAPGMIERDEVVNNKGTNKLAAIFFAAVIGFTIGAFIMICLPAVRVYSDRLDAVSDGSVFIREDYRFSDIAEICHISARYNDYGDRIERPSYVLVMKDGRRLDLDGSTSDRRAEEELLPLLSEYSIPITELDSDRDLKTRAGKTG